MYNKRNQHQFRHFSCLIAHRPEHHPKRDRSLLSRMNSFSSCVLGLLLVSLVSVYADEAAFKAVMKCKKDNNIPMEKLIKACDDDISAIEGWPCFTKCFEEFTGLIGSDGKIHPEMAGALVGDADKARAIEVATQCAKGFDVIDTCDKAAAMDKCGRTTDADIYGKTCRAILAKLVS